MAKKREPLDEFEEIVANFEAALAGFATPVRNYDLDVLDSYPISAAIPSAKGVEVDTRKQAYGAVKARSERDFIFMDSAAIERDAQYGITPQGTALHEAEHLLARKQLGNATAVNDKFDQLIGSSKPRQEIAQALVSKNVKDYLQKTYGLNDAYFDPRTSDRSFGGAPSEMFYEQLASLSSLEQTQKVDLTKDTFMRQFVFNTPEKRSVYNAMVGLRQTRLDSKDLPPYTPIPEKPGASTQYVPAFYEKLLDFLFKR